MKILLLGNPYWRTDFELLGHEVMAVTLNSDSDVRIKGFPAGIHEVLDALPGHWNPDLVLVGDASTYPMVIGLELLEVPLVWYAIDSHIHLPWHRAYAAAFDLILVAQRDYVPSYTFDEDRQVVRWCPLYCNPHHDRILPGPKLHDLCFVGTLNPEWNPDRVRLIEALRERVSIHVSSGDYVEPFNRAHAVLNQCISNDVNFRTFQALACGSLLVMERVGNGLTELFQDGAHFVLYEKGNVEQIIELVHYYNAHEGEREAIAATGRAAVLASHTGLHRAQMLLDLLAQQPVNQSIVLRKVRLMEIQFVLGKVYEYAARAYGCKAQEYEPGSRTWLGTKRVEEMYTVVAAQIERRLQIAQGRGVA